MIEEKIILDMLTQDSVSVITQKYIIVEGEVYPIGQPHRKAYMNTEQGRQEVIDELGEAQKNAVLAVWGDEPVIADPPASEAP